MNIPMQQPGPMGMNPMVQSNPVQMGPAQHGMHPNQPPMQQPQEKLDNISKVKSLVGPLRDSLSLALKSAAQTLYQNNLIDTSKGADPQDYRFNKNIEEFFAICDQIELHLKTSIECINQHSMSTRYMPVNVNPLRIDNIPSPDALNYPQYLMTARSQVQYTRDVHNALSNAARSIANNE
ncbi:hypothetical protein QAD02_023224 [Eretmocerus hayati]|uniref:Uncharacterized protein n=1 Tax=Eretmocerus hayati TaxID=131215 RepID=A0ACC2PV08_9HYME|nr:hypothetical protein QAD02_023224 [Eretmocerus hayati]